MKFRCNKCRKYYDSEQPAISCHPDILVIESDVDLPDPRNLTPHEAGSQALELLRRVKKLYYEENVDLPRWLIKEAGAILENA